MQIPPFSLSAQISEIGDEIEEEIIKVFRSGKYIGGETVKNFEEAFASEIQTSFAVGCNSGTDALILALRALNIRQGDEVITSSFSFFATAEAITSVGAKPVFVEIDPENFLLDLKLIEKAITPNTKAIMPVHLFGCPNNMDQLMEIAKRNCLKVIEDCAQAAGAQWKGKPVGSFGDVGCFSFFPTKNLGAAGDGGAITTNSPDLAKSIRELAIHGMPKRYLHTEFGYNSRLDSIQAAILNIKLPRLNSWVKRRNEIANYYIDKLGNIEGIQIPSKTREIGLGHCWNQFVIRIMDDNNKHLSIIKNTDTSLSNQELTTLNKSQKRDLFKLELQKYGVNTIIYYPIPIHLQPAYEKYGYVEGYLPITENVCNQVISLPIFPELSFSQQSYIVDTINKIYKNNFK